MADSFDPDAYLKNKQSSGGGFDPDAYLSYKASKGPAGPSEGESAARQFAGGATMGLDDELGGAFGAAGRVAGIKNLASWKPFEKDSHLEFAMPSVNPDDLEQAYTENRDSLRDDQHADVETNPGASMAGKIGGGVASAFIPGLGVLNASKGATLGASIGKGALAGAAQGGITGFGESEAKNAGDIARDTAIGAGVGAGIGGAIPVAGYLGQKALAGTQGAAKALHRGAESLAETATGATGAQAAKFENGAGRELLDRGLVRFGDTAEKIGQRTDVAMQMANRDIDDALRSLDAQGVTASAENVVSSLQEKIGQLRKDPSQAGVVRRLEKTILDIMETGQSAVPISEAEITKRGFNKAAGNWLDPEAGQAGKHAYLGYMDEVERAAREADPTLANKFEAGKKTYGLLKPIQQAAEKRGLQQAQSPIGGFGDVVSAGVGGAPGLITKRLVQPRLASSAAVATDKIADIVGSMPEVLGKFAKPLQDASARGGNSLGATHFILQQTNPEYREILRKVAEENEESQR